MSWPLTAFWEIQTVPIYSPISLRSNVSPWKMNIIFNLGVWQRGMCVTGLNVLCELHTQVSTTQVTKKRQILIAFKAEKSNSSLSVQNLVLNADYQDSF